MGEIKSKLGHYRNPGLGAEQSRVLGMVLREVGMPIGVGLAIGMGAALATTRFVAGFLPARRAAGLEPMKALREE